MSKTSVKKSGRLTRGAKIQAPPVGGFALMVINSARVRKKAFSECLRIRKGFQKAEEELQAFEMRDKPAYVRWYRAEFGPRIEEIRALKEESNALIAQMNRIERFAYLRRCSVRQAAALFEQTPDEFARIEKALNERIAREREEERRRREREIEEEKQCLLEELLDFLKSERRRILVHLKRGERPSRVLCDILQAISFDTGVPGEILVEIIRRPESAATLKYVGLESALDHLDREMAEDPYSSYDDESDDPFGDFENQYGAADNVSSRGSAEPQADNRARIKILWRELAFALHPDHSDSGSNPAKMSLWHEAQAATEAGDLDRLEILHAHVLLQRGELSGSTPVSRIMSLTQMYREGCNALRRKIRQLRKQPIWGFASAGESQREEVRRIVNQQLDVEFLSAKSRLTVLKSEYARNFAPRPATARDASRKPKASDDNGTPFFSGWENI